MTVETRTVAVLLHPERPEAPEAVTVLMSRVPGFRFLSFSDDVKCLRELTPGTDLESIDGKPAELTIVFGGDGILPRAVEWAQSLDVPLLGVNLGHVGSLVELETSDLTSLSQAMIDGRYETEQRLVLRVDVANVFGKILRSLFTVNEVSLEKLMREEILNVLVHVDAHPLSRWGCDGVLVATLTGSTTYAFSGGGPVVWSEVQVILPMPLFVHALFNGFMVLSPGSHVSLELSGPVSQGIIWCDGRRSFEVEPGQWVAVRASGHPPRLARFPEQHSMTRLVWKFRLPIDGWRRPPWR